MKASNTLIVLTSLLALSCGKEGPTIDGSTPDSGPVILNAGPQAVQGEILIKVKTTSPVTKAGGYEDLRSLNDEMADILEEAGTVRFERLFTPDPRFEERTRAEGLDRWFIMEYDGPATPEAVAESLGGCRDLEVIECSLPLDGDGVEDIPGPVGGHARVLSTKGAVAATSPFNDPGVNQMRQWDLNNTGIIGNVQSEPGADCNVYRAWELCTGSPDVIVAVFDNGVKYDHEDLAANIWTNPGEIPDNGVDDDGNGYIDDIHGWNFIDNSGKITFFGKQNHGTHVAGTISAVNNNGIGICGIAGGSGRGDGVKIMSIQILGEGESGDNGAGTSGKIRAMKYAADNGAVVSSNSWGYRTGKISLESWKFGVYSSYTDAVKYFVKYAGIGPDGSQTAPMAGGIVVCSAGNDATADLLHYPSCDENVLAIAAHGMTGAPASYTNYASWVTLTAPGGDLSQNNVYGGIYSTSFPEGKEEISSYEYKNGTSMACPHVSGALALAISYFWGPEHNKGLTPKMLRDALISGTRDINRYCPQAYKGKMGIGALDTYALLKNVKMIAVPIPELTLKVGESRQVNLEDYFVNTYAFKCSVSDEAVAEVSLSRGVLTVKALVAGKASVTVCDAKSITKEMNVTVVK